MREHELHYVDSRLSLTRTLREINRCTIRFHVDRGWQLLFRVTDSRGGESLFALELDPHAAEPIEGPGGTVHTIRHVEGDDWLVWPPVELAGWEGVIVVVGMPRAVPWKDELSTQW